MKNITILHSLGKTNLIYWSTVYRQDSIKSTVGWLAKIFFFFLIIWVNILGGFIKQRRKTSNYFIKVYLFTL